MVVSAEGAIKANQSAAAEAAERLREINAWLWRYEPTPSLLMPNGKRVGYVHSDADERVRTIRTREEFDLLLARLVIYAKPHRRTNYRGQVYIRDDGVEIGIRESEDNGPTIDIFRDGPEKPPVARIHLLGGGKCAVHIIEELSYKTGGSLMDRPRIRRNVIPFVFSRQDEIMKNSRSSLREYATNYAVFPGDPNNFSFTLQVIIDAFGSDRKTLEGALRYFLTHIIGHGLAPMNWVNATDHEYGPVTKYGVRPQEIIDNIMAAWLAGGDYFVDDFELMFGWEHYCGAFIEDDTPEDDTPEDEARGGR